MVDTLRRLQGRRVLIALTVGLATAVVVGLLVVGTTTAAPVPAPPAIAPAVGPGPADNPIVVLGASISAGTGSSPEQAWPELVGRCLGRRVVVGAVPGSGYVTPGRGQRGPVARLLREADLARLHPSLVVLQAGHNDIGAPEPKLRAAVTTAVQDVGHQVPGTPLALITVFAHVGVPTAEARSTDATIVDAARRADPQVIVLDPLVQGWSFPRVGDGLHPTAVGQRLLAGHVLDGLTQAGVAGPGTCSGTPPAPPAPHPSGHLTPS
ncbi:GDSL-type esterase/lipase family protein [Actinomycetospora endophytica]|uniref:GDSL-type esterase/lipase family protein n=1 Tax=Actinomycetospora endophytica TaxID=2291215 RepID=A0ABS8PB64_9PSEU|nr:GDSL-type esterase/lipase family protein [Actinomycetospora endophytica]MCD2195509.1 GDSL-type esterase/lipase family protein [Actinomycetospora endophytica]